MHTSDRDRELQALGRWLHLAGLALLLGGGLAYYTLVLLPLDRQQEQTAQRLGKLDRLLQTADQTRRRHAELRTALAELRQRAETVRQQIPDQPQEAEFLRQLSQTADEEGLQLRDYRRGKVTEQEHYWQLEVHLIGEGDYRSLCTFLDRLAQLPRAATIDKLEIKADANSQVYPLDLTLRLYYGVKRPAADGRRKPTHG